MYKGSIQALQTERVTELKAASLVNKLKDAGAMLLLAVVLWGLAQFLAAFFSILWLGWVGHGAAALTAVFGIVTSSKSTTGECPFCGGDVGSTADVLEYLENDGMVVECPHCR